MNQSSPGAVVASSAPAWGGWAIAAVCAALVAQIAWNSRRSWPESFEAALPLLQDLGLLLIGAAMSIAAFAVVRPLWTAATVGLLFVGIFLAKFGAFYASFLLAPNALRIRELAEAPGPDGHGPGVAVVTERSRSPWQAASGLCAGVALLGIGAIALFDTHDMPSAGTRWLVGALCLVGALGAVAYGIFALNDPEPPHARQLLLAPEWLRLPGAPSPLAWTDVVEIKPVARPPSRHAVSADTSADPGSALLEFIGSGGESLGTLPAGALPRPERATPVLDQLLQNASLRAGLSGPGGAKRVKRLLGVRSLF